MRHPRLQTHSIRAGTPCFFRPPLFEFDAEAIRDAVHVVEVGDDLIRIDYGPVVETSPPKVLDIISSHAVRSERQLYRVATQSGQTCTDVFKAPRGDRLRKRGITRFPG